MRQWPILHPSAITTTEAESGNMERAYKHWMMSHQLVVIRPALLDSNIRPARFGQYGCNRLKFDSLKQLLRRDERGSNRHFHI